MASLGRYELGDRLGRGGFATVYRAWDPLLRREVALKALSLDLSEEPDMRRRFLAEAQALAGLRHPHIVTVYDVGETPERPFFAMELIDGRALDQWLAEQGRLDLPEVIAIITDLADALDLVHTAGLVHRDVKAANVMLAQERGRRRVVLMDFGIARRMEGPRFTATNIAMLSPDTAAPEQIQNRPLGPAADVYSLGVLTYWMLAGRPPFVGDTAAVLHAHVYEPPPPLSELRPGLPGPVYEAVQTALTKDPAGRPASAGAFATMLRRAVDTIPLRPIEPPSSSAVPGNAPPAASRPPQPSAAPSAPHTPTPATQPAPMARPPSAQPPPAPSTMSTPVSTNMAPESTLVWSGPEAPPPAPPPTPATPPPRSRFTRPALAAASGLLLVVIVAGYLLTRGNSDGDGLASSGTPTSPTITTGAGQSSTATPASSPTTTVQPTRTATATTGPAMPATPVASVCPFITCMPVTFAGGRSMEIRTAEVESWEISPAGDVVTFRVKVFAAPRVTGATCIAVDPITVRCMVPAGARMIVDATPR
jgi:eukaryotic-like serine/threonine-protein kinase